MFIVRHFEYKLWEPRKVNAVKLQAQTEDQNSIFASDNIVNGNDYEQVFPLRDYGDYNDNNESEDDMKEMETDHRYCFVEWSCENGKIISFVTFAIYYFSIWFWLHMVGNLQDLHP